MNSPKSLADPRYHSVSCRSLVLQDLAVITEKDFNILLDELLAYEAAGKLDAIVA